MTIDDAPLFSSIALAEIEQAFAAAHAPATPVEVANLADSAIGALLTGRGYRPEAFENVLGRALGGPRRRGPVGR